MSQLNWRHHTLIQALLSRGPLKDSDFHSVYSGVTGKNPDTHASHFNDFLLKINKELAYVSLELRACIHQYDGKVYYGIVNNISDEQSKLGTKYTVPQIAFYKGVIEAIVQENAGQGCITNIEALNVRIENQVPTSNSSEGSQSQIPAAFRNFSISQKEKTLADLIQDRWLCSTPDDKIGLGVRSFLDLRSWFHSNEVPSCDVCNEAGVKALSCAKEDCSIRIHDYCLKKKYSRRKVPRVCPGCQTAWPLPGTNSDRDQEEEEEEEEGTGNRQDNASSSARANGRRLRAAKAEAVEASDPQSQQRSVRRKRLRSCKAEAVEGDQDGNGTQETQSSMPLDNRRTLRSRHK